MAPPDGSTFAAALQAAVTDFSEHGYDDDARLRYWLGILRSRLEAETDTPAELAEQLKAALTAIYQRKVEAGGLIRDVRFADRFDLTRIKPRLRAELDRRILAAADLIKLNRKAGIEKTLQRFSGWSTSIPPGGSGVIDKREVRANIAKSAKQIRYEARRLTIDQGHKLVANITDIVATDNGAIAAEWESHWRQPGYDYRPDHKERDGKVYLIRDSWAAKHGLIKRGMPFIDQVTRPAEEPFCRCNYRYISNLNNLPPEMLTKKGRDFVAGKLRK